MLPESDGREPPRVVVVPPPRAPFMHWGLVMCMLFFGVGPFVWLPFGPPLIRLFPLVAAAAMAVPVWLDRRRCRRFNAERAAWLEHHDAWEDDALACQIDRHWNALTRPPDLDAVKQILSRHPENTVGRAVVVCLGAWEPPAPGDHRLEPEVLTPSQAMLPFAFGRTRQSTLLVCTILILALAVINFTGVVPESMFAYVFFGAMCGAIGIALVYRFVLRPSYLRVAPGMIQILTYSLGRSRPMLRSYPLTGGTIVLVADTLDTRRLVLSRGKMTDTVAIRSRREGRFWQSFWLAVLSTAPTPPLSEEELVG